MSGWEERLAALPARALPGGLTLYEAQGFGARLKGLAGVDALPPDVALHIPRTSSIHTFRMRFALDLVWLDRDGAVVAVVAGVPRRRNRMCRRARSVIETAEGSGERFAEALRAAS